MEKKYRHKPTGKIFEKISIESITYYSDPREHGTVPDYIVTGQDWEEIPSPLIIFGFMDSGDILEFKFDRRPTTGERSKIYNAVKDSLLNGESFTMEDMIELVQFNSPGSSRNTCFDVVSKFLNQRVRT